ncbi:ligand-binding sensor domain-containing protein [Adhaeribacter pallidiroseus]|uniref:Sensor histidine kinase MctS n=1 Tax=Adhaeribacter pallidiroseus TaxID=2072847 RepID=A0A369QH17_9BACT|nr:two-component regulator propeller domain-containing protein [Adhaeribacter pallidiroseus]RDC64201.1 Sensor histidine kinase MctS [Adhaeribacter pallidiroseus]
MRTFLKSGLCWWLCCSTYALYGQNLFFDKLTTQNGLSNNKVNCILQDKRGFIWFGTEDGLNRYDGNTMVIFRSQPGSSSGLSGNIVTGLHLDQHQIMWITTADGGLTRYDYRLPYAQQFKKYRHLPHDSTSIPVNILNALVEDKRGYLWLATSGYGILRFNKQTERFDQIKYQGVKTALALTLRRDTVWAGMQGSGLLKIDTRTSHSISDTSYKSAYLKLPHVTVTSLYTDPAENVWYGSWDNILYRYNAQLKKEENFPVAASPVTAFTDEASSFADDHRGQLWIGGRYEGLHLFDQQRKTFQHIVPNPQKAGSLLSNKINCIYRDRDGNMWLGTDKGVSTYNLYQQQFTPQVLPVKSTTTQPGRINDFYLDAQQTLWIATSDGLFKKFKISPAFTHILLNYQGTNLAVGKIHQSTNGTFYLGTNYSLFQFNPSTHAIALLSDQAQDLVMSKIIASRIVSIVDFKINNQPVLITAPYGHFLTYYDFAAQKWVSRADSARQIIARLDLKDNLIRKLYKTSPGGLWMATAKSGLAEWKNSQSPHFIYYQHDPINPRSLSSDNVYDIAEDQHHNLWVSTYGGGLNYFNTKTKTFRHFPESPNLIQGITVDKSGKVWMVSNGNLHSYDPDQNQFASYHLLDYESTGGLNGSIYQDPAGTIYLGASNYFIKFKPSSIQSPAQPEKPVFTDFRIFDTYRNELLQQKEIKLAYNQNFFSFTFSSPNYVNPDNITYSYRLEGLDKSWRNAGRVNSAGYTNLPAGRYIFKVRAVNGAQVPANQVTTMAITIVPPFWERWWFYGLVTAVLASLIYLMYQYRIDQLLKRQAIRNKIAQDLHDSVGSTLSSISVYSQVAQIKSSAVESAEVNQLLTKISTISNEMISEMNDIVWAINPVNDSLDKIIIRIESFGRPLLRANNIVFKINRDALPPGIDVGMEKSKDIYLILKEALTNCAKHAGAQNVTLHLKLQHKRILMQVIDDGKGLTDADQLSPSLSGNGLRNIKNRVKNLNGQLHISSNSNGTTIAINFKIT